MNIKELKKILRRFPSTAEINIGAEKLGKVSAKLDSETNNWTLVLVAEEKSEQITDDEKNNEN